MIDNPAAPADIERSAVIYAAGRSLGLRRIEWVIFGLKTRETWGLRGDFAFYGIWNLSMTDGWHEHRNVDGGFGIHIRFLVFDLNRQCAAFLVTRKRA